MRHPTGDPTVMGVDSQSASRPHCYVDVTPDGQIKLTDMSRYGTYINGTLIHHSSQFLCVNDKMSHGFDMDESCVVSMRHFELYRLELWHEAPLPVKAEVKEEEVEDIDESSNLVIDTEAIPMVEIPEEFSLPSEVKVEVDLANMDMIDLDGEIIELSDDDDAVVEKQNPQNEENVYPNTQLLFEELAASTPPNVVEIEAPPNSVVNQEAPSTSKAEITSEEPEINKLVEGLNTNSKKSDEEGIEEIIYKLSPANFSILQSAVEKRKKQAKSTQQPKSKNDKKCKTKDETHRN